MCGCGTTIDIGRALPIVRDLSDVDHHDAEVDRHVWYHSSIYQDWPLSAAAYRHITAARIVSSLLPPDQHEEAIDEQCSLALHLGTYAAAVENTMRRMRDQDFSNEKYWLHQVEIRLHPGDLSPGVSGELSTWFGDVPLTKLTELGARAVRYVNAQEAVGSISLVIDPQVITKIRTIQLPVAAAILPATEAGDQAVILATNDLEAAEQLRPDITGVPESQIFDSSLKATLAARRGMADGRAVEIAQQIQLYRGRQAEIWASLTEALVDAYLFDVNTQVREQFTSVLPTETDPIRYHDRFRLMASLLAQPAAVVQRFEGASWRVPNLNR